MKRKLLYIATYDVKKPSRRRKIHLAIEQYATGGQRSAYECYLDSNERTSLCRQIRQILNPDTDRFALLPVESRSQILVSGIAVLPSGPDFYYVG